MWSPRRVLGRDVTGQRGMCVIWRVNTDIGRPVRRPLLMIPCELISEEGRALGWRDRRAEHARGSLFSLVLQILPVVFFTTSTREEE